VTSAAFHVDQPFARVPGGIGAYVRGLVPALAAAEPGLDLTLFHARFDEQPEAWMRDLPRVQLRQRIRTLYPSWVRVDPTSVKDLAAAISAVLDDDAARARMTEAGLPQAAKFSWEPTAGETLDAYREAA
jgi:glycosyltransferase involved in cell wall biosynthesis